MLRMDLLLKLTLSHMMYEDRLLAFRMEHLQSGESKILFACVLDYVV